MQSAAAQSHTRAGESLAACSIIEVFSPGRSFHCKDSGGRAIVLKKLDEDCLLDGQLHPSIKERLLRVRELAQRRVATLFTVERVGLEAFLVWDYLPGQTLQEYLDLGACSPARFVSLSREIALTIDALHSLGIVHGSIHARNIIVDSNCHVMLTHVSPLLYSDEREDARTALEVFREMITRCRLENSTVGGWVMSGEPVGMTLREIAAKLAILNETEQLPETISEPRALKGTRKRILWIAVAVVVMAICIATLIYLGTIKGLSPPSVDWVPLEGPRQ